MIVHTQKTNKHTKAHFLTMCAFSVCVCLCASICVLCASQGWSSTSCWWATLLSGMRTSTSCTSRSRPGLMMWAFSPLLLSHFSPPLTRSLVPFWQWLRNSVTSFIFHGVQVREPHLRSHLSPGQMEGERDADWLSGRDSGLIVYRPQHLWLNITGPDGFRISYQIARGCAWTVIRHTNSWVHIWAWDKKRK